MISSNRARLAVARLVTDPQPSRASVVLTCMDVRIDPLAVLGLHMGEAHVLRNAGGRVTDDVLRSLAVSSHALGTRVLTIMQHTGCGLRGTTDADLRALTGADLDFHTISDHTSTLQSDVMLVASTPYLGRLKTIAGLVYDVDKGTLEQLVLWDRP